MTRKHKYLHKLANAIRRWKGTWSRPPMKAEKANVVKWYGRCEFEGYLKDFHAPKP